MEKLSVYELLSFILPGVVVVELARWGIGAYLGTTINLQVSNLLANGLLYLVIVLLVGCTVHVFTFKILLTCGWFKTIAYKNIQELTLSGLPKEVIPTLNNRYYERGEKSKDYDERVPAPDLFDHAYFFLEVEGSLEQAKSFQSIYFLFRNLLAIATIVLPFAVILIIGNLCSGDSMALESSLTLLCVGLFVSVMLVYVTRWFRIKFVERVFGTYYAYIKHYSSHDHK